MKEFNYIDIFAGCGGLSLGLHNAGWKGLFAIEKSKDAFATLKYNLVDAEKHFCWNKWAIFIISSFVLSICANSSYPRSSQRP